MTRLLLLLCFITLLSCDTTNSRVDRQHTLTAADVLRLYIYSKANDSPEATRYLVHLLKEYPSSDQALYALIFCIPLKGTYGEIKDDLDKTSGITPEIIEAAEHFTHRGTGVKVDVKDETRFLEGIINSHSDSATSRIVSLFGIYALQHLLPSAVESGAGDIVNLINKTSGTINLASTCSSAERFILYTALERLAEDPETAYKSTQLLLYETVRGGTVTFYEDPLKNMSMNPASIALMLHVGTPYADVERDLLVVYHMAPKGENLDKGEMEMWSLAGVNLIRYYHAIGKLENAKHVLADMKTKGFTANGLGINHILEELEATDIKPVDPMIIKGDDVRQTIQQLQQAKNC